MGRNKTAGLPRQDQALVTAERFAGGQRIWYGPDSARMLTAEQAAAAPALWRHHGVRATVVVTFDYTSLALLELLRRQVDRTASGATNGPLISAAFMINGGLFADAHTPLTERNHHDRDDPLLERNEQFAATYTPAPLGPPTAQALIITSLGHRAGPRSPSASPSGPARPPCEGPISMHPHLMQEIARQRDGNCAGQDGNPLDAQDHQVIRRNAQGLGGHH